MSFKKPTKVGTGIKTKPVVKHAMSQCLQTSRTIMKSRQHSRMYEFSFIPNYVLSNPHNPANLFITKPLF